MRKILPTLLLSALGVLAGSAAVQTAHAQESPLPVRPALRMKPMRSARMAPPASMRVIVVLRKPMSSWSMRGMGGGARPG